MSVIDQRILVIAPVEVVWLYLTDPALVSKWHRGAKQVSTLTTKLTGVGMRRRCVDTRGRAVVEEMTAWLDNIGYEYGVIDGPYRSFKGRVRLQPVPEGVIVNWTIDYGLRGPLAGLRNLLSRRRMLRRQMADSLRALRRLIDASGVMFDPAKHAKVAMQADPGIEARMARINEPTRTATTSFPARPIPIIGDDDLPDLTVVSQPTSIPTSIPTAAPLAANTQTVVGTSASQSKATDDDTKPRPPKGLREAIEKLDQTDNLAAYGSPTVPASLVAPPRPSEPPTQTLVPGVTIPPRHTSPAPVNLPEPIKPPAPVSKPPEVGKAPPKPEVLPDEPVPKPSTPPPPVDSIDTGEMSIWDIFGIERPSQRNKAELDAVIASLQTPPPRPASRVDALHGVGATPHRPLKAHIKTRQLKTRTHRKAKVRVRPYRFAP